MVGQAKEIENIRLTRVGRWKRWLAGTLVVGGICLLVWKGPGEPLEHRIATINARHALLPDDNAATIYNQLLAANPDDPNLTPARLAALIKASQIESCWFSLKPGQQGWNEQGRRRRAMQAWARALVKDARSDLTQGRVDAAAANLRGVLRMADHLRQQALMADFGLACDVEARVGSCVRDFVMQPDAGLALLQMVEALPLDLADDRPQVFQLISEVEPLMAASILSEWTLRQRVQIWWGQLRGPRDRDILLEWYMRPLALRRGVRILVGLRCYYDANNRWPDSLGEIRTLVPAQALIDPYAGQLFIYKKASDGFRLHAIGANKIDENGTRIPKGPDDFLIWPPWGLV